MADVFDFYVLDNRKITFQIAEPIMREDSGVTDFRFHIPKSINNLDMSDWSWWFVFVNAKKEKYSVALTLSDDPESPLEFNIATYTVDYAMSIKAGAVQFALEAINTGTGGAIDNEWHTLTYETKVKETLQGNQAEYAETESDIISALIQEVRTKVNQLVGGATPLPVSAVSAMTDTSKLYLLTTDGEWYYYNGSNFVPGGLYGAGIQIDPTLSQSGQAADAKAVGNELINVGDFEKSTFKNSVSFSRLTTYSYWTFGQEIVEGTGANAVNNKAGRSTYIEFAEPVLIVLDNAEYEYVVWVYSSDSISGALYSPIKAYKNKPLIILPKASTSYFRIGVKRADGTTLTTDYSDTTSDAYKILNALHTYTLTSHTLDVDNVPIDAKAVKDNALIFKGFLEDNADLNSVTDSGVYILLSSCNYSNSPITVGYLFVYKIEIVKAQLAYSLGTSETFLPHVYVRYGSGSSGSTISSVWRMIGRGRKTAIKMACFGDSIMYGQNGNTSSRVDEQYRIPSILAYNLNIEATNYGVGSQGYIGLISEKAYDNIASKDLTQFNAMLMCYGVNDGYKNLGTWDSTDETTIMGQFNKIVAYVFSQNPSIRLIVVAPYNGRNVGTFPKYWYGDRTHPDGYVSRQVLSDTLKQACEYYNIPYIEQKNSPINGYTIQTLIGTDGVHPSLEGYFQLGAWLSGEVGRLIG